MGRLSRADESAGDVERRKLTSHAMSSTFPDRPATVSWTRVRSCGRGSTGLPSRFVDGAMRALGAQAMPIRLSMRASKLR